MAFNGLFIGIDRYSSPEINWLSCANRDATALHALFTDTLGGETTLLTDEQATVAAIQESFERLVASDPDDVVAIAFSGHGTETHELVAHDTDPYDLAATTIPLTVLGEWCARIPARRLLMGFDGAHRQMFQQETCVQPTAYPRRRRVPAKTQPGRRH